MRLTPKQQQQLRDAMLEEAIAATRFIKAVQDLPLDEKFVIQRQVDRLYFADNNDRACEEFADLMEACQRVVSIWNDVAALKPQAFGEA
jgi:hypothetical protein